MTEKPGWTPDRDAAIRALIRQTIDSAGAMPPDQLPHHIRTRLAGQIDGRPDIEGYIAQILKEERKKSGR